MWLYKRLKKTCCAVMIELSRLKIFIKYLNIPVLEVEILKLDTSFSVSHVNSVKNWSS